jgi:hypothetical protein
MGSIPNVDSLGRLLGMIKFNSNYLSLDDVLEQARITVGQIFAL